MLGRTYFTLLADTKPSDALSGKPDQIHVLAVVHAAKDDNIGALFEDVQSTIGKPVVKWAHLRKERKINYQIAFVRALEKSIVKHDVCIYHSTATEEEIENLAVEKSFKWGSKIAYDPSGNRKSLEVGPLGGIPTVTPGAPPKGMVIEQRISPIVSVNWSRAAVAIWIFNLVSFIRNRIMRNISKLWPNPTCVLHMDRLVGEGTKTDVTGLLNMMLKLDDTSELQQTFSKGDIWADLFVDCVVGALYEVYSNPSGKVGKEMDRLAKANAEFQKKFIILSKNPTP